MTPVGDAVSAPAAAAPAMSAARRQATDPAPGHAEADADRRDRDSAPRGRVTAGAPDPSGQSGSLVDVFA